MLQTFHEVPDFEVAIELEALQALHKSQAQYHNCKTFHNVE